MITIRSAHGRLAVVVVGDFRLVGGVVDSVFGRGVRVCRDAVVAGILAVMGTVSPAAY